MSRILGYAVVLDLDDGTEHSRQEPGWITLTLASGQVHASFMPHTLEKRTTFTVTGHIRQGGIGFLVTHGACLGVVPVRSALSDHMTVTADWND